MRTRIEENLEFRLCPWKIEKGMQDWSIVAEIGRWTYCYVYCFGVHFQKWTVLPDALVYQQGRRLEYA